MIINQLNRSDAEKIYISAFNASGARLSVGQFVCWDWRNSSSLGSAVNGPTASTITLFAGVVAHRTPTYADWPANSFGLVQCYGVHGSVAYSIANTSVSCAGDWLVPVATLYSGGYVDISGVGLSRYSQNLFVNRGAFLMQNDLSAKGWAYAFVRAM